MTARNQLPAWQQLTLLAKKNWSLVELFADATRATEFQATSKHILFDYSKQCVDTQVMQSLYTLAEECELADRIEAMCTGQIVNGSEGRPALHTALRMPKDAALFLDGMPVVSAVQSVLAKVETLANRLRQGVWRGYSGKAIKDVVNIGVGGSDLGPLMVATALDEWADTDIRVHFVSNMDGTQLSSLLKKLHPESTLFIISSKSFSTVDTLSNASTALQWLMQACQQRDSILRHHFIGISTRLDKMTDWGIHPDHQLQLWDWVGGRFSLWSSIGLAIAVRIGMPNFRALLAGAHDMDEHFRQRPYAQNLPVLLGLLGVWNATFLQIHAHTVLPYDGRLRYLPSYLTQLEMESNGKSVDITGQVLNYATSPILWGEVGSNAQHAFYQLLHQGTQKVSCDFIVCARRYHQAKNGDLQYQHELNIANCLAQSRVLAFGNHAIASGTTSSEMDKFKRYRGNQPSTTLLLDELSPATLGALIALYEHKVYVMASIWNINPFDQWGVEMGKQVAGEVLAHWQQLKQQVPNLSPDNAEISDTFDASTQGLLQAILRQQNQVS